MYLLSRCRLPSFDHKLFPHPCPTCPPARNASQGTRAGWQALIRGFAMTCVLAPVSIVLLSCRVVLCFCRFRAECQSKIASAEGVPPCVYAPAGSLSRQRWLPAPMSVGQPTGKSAMPRWAYARRLRVRRSGSARKTARAVEMRPCCRRASVSGCT